MSAGATQEQLEREPAPQRSSSGGRGRGALGTVVSLLALGAVVLWASNQPTPSFPSEAGALGLLAGAVAAYAVGQIARGWRWHTILVHAGIPHKHADATALISIGYMGNTVLPARGGEFLRIFLLGSRTGASRRAVLGTILSERVLDAGSLVLVFAVVTLVGVGGSPLGTSPALWALGGLVAAAAGLWLYLRLRVAGRFERVAALVRPVVGTAKPLLGAWGGVLFAVSVSLWGLEAVIFWLTAQSLDITMTIPEALFIVVLTSLTSLIPAAPGYVGTFEAAAVFGLHALDVTGSDAVSYVLLIRLVLFGPVTLAGLILLAVRFGGLGSLRARRDAPAQA